MKDLKKTKLKSLPFTNFFSLGFYFLTAAILFLSLLISSQSLLAGTLDKIKKYGSIRCGVHKGLAGFSVPNKKRKWSGIDVDICKALAAAIFNDPEKVQFVPLTAQQRFTALQSGEVDLLSRVTTFTLQRDTAQGLNFVHPTYYDGQGFMVRKKDKIKSLKALNGATICVNQGTTTELNLADYFRQHKMKYKIITLESRDELLKVFLKKRCDAITGDASSLAANRVKFKNPKNYEILPTLIAKEPLTPAVRHGDDRWYDIVKWTVYALIAAEEMGIDSKNVHKMLKSSSPKVKRFLGVIPGNGKALGLSKRWAYQIIKHVGNYKQVYDRNLGKKSPLKIKRGLNRLWTHGGLMYAPPFK